MFPSSAVPLPPASPLLRRHRRFIAAIAASPSPPLLRHRSRAPSASKNIFTESTSSFGASAMAMPRLGMPVEVPTEEGSRKKSRGRPASASHFHQDVEPTHFCKILMAPGIGVLPLPDAFRPYLGAVPGKMIVKTTTGCHWEMNIKEVSGKAILDAGWSDFAVAHDLKIGYMLFFKKLSAKEYKVVIFDYSCCEVVGRCPAHPECMKRPAEDDE